MGANVATTLKKKTPTSRRKTVSFDELRTLTARRQRSSFPVDARVERAYWLKQIRTLIGEDA